PTYLFLRGDTVLGHLTTIPVKVLAGGRTRPGYWLVGFMVHPEHRNGPIGFWLLKEAVGDLPLAFSLTVQTGPQPPFDRMGFSKVGVVPNLIRPLNSARMLSRLDLDAIGVGSAHPMRKRLLAIARAPYVATPVGAAIDAALRLYADIRSPSGIVRFSDSAPLEHEIKALWTSVCDSVAPTALRDSAYLLRRYEPGATSPYRWVTVHDGGNLRGLLVLRAPRAEGDPRLAGIRVATIADILCDPRERV